MKYGDVDLNLIVVLERVLSRQSVSEAAVDLGLSQPATSRALQRLRDALGDPLLVRAGRSMIPTDRARQLLPLAATALAASEAVFAPPDGFDPECAEGRFVVAIGGEVEEVFAAPLFHAFASRVPGIDLRFRSLGGVTVDEGRRGLIDVAIAPDLSALPAIAGAPDLGEFVAQPLYTRHFKVVGARARWSEPPDFAAYLEASHVIVSFEAGGRGFVDELLEEMGHRRRVAASVTSFPAMARLVAASHLLAVMPSELAHAVGDALSVHPPPIRLPELPMLMIWHPRERAQSRHRYLRELVREVIISEITRQRAAAATARSGSPRGP